MNTIPNASQLAGYSASEAALGLLISIAVVVGIAVWVRRRRLSGLYTQASGLMAQMAVQAARGQLTPDTLSYYDRVVFEYEVYRLLPLSRLLGQGLAPLPWSGELELPAYAPQPQPQPQAPAQGQYVSYPQQQGYEQAVAAQPAPQMR